MRVKFWGVRGTRPTPSKLTQRYGGNTTCVEVRGSDGELLIIDAGTGIAPLGEALVSEATEKPIRATLLITHTHWDHIEGFRNFLPNFIPGSEITVIGPAGSAKSLQEAFAGQMDPAYFPVKMDQMPVHLDFKEIQISDVLELAGLRIIPFRLSHPIVTFGYRVEEGNKSFVFATDNEMRLCNKDDLREWAMGADLFAHDSQYSEEEYKVRKGWGHSTFVDCLEMASQAEARRLGLIHHDPVHSDSVIDQLVQEAIEDYWQKGGSPLHVFAAAEEQVFDL